MEVVVRLSKAELADMEMSAEQLKWTITEDLDNSRDYPGFDVKVEVIKEE